MASAKRENPKVELWEGYEVEVNLQLINDVDYLSDYATAEHQGDFATLITMTFALVGGDTVYKDTREHITAAEGFFAADKLNDILRKVRDAAFPKVGAPASKRSWQTARS